MCLRILQHNFSRFRVVSGSSHRVIKKTPKTNINLSFRRSIWSTFNKVQWKQFSLTLLLFFTHETHLISCHIGHYESAPEYITGHVFFFLLSASVLLGVVRYKRWARKVWAAIKYKENLPRRPRWR